MGGLTRMCFAVSIGQRSAGRAARHMCMNADEEVERLCSVLSDCADVRTAVDAVDHSMRRAGVSEPASSAEYIVGRVVGANSRSALRRRLDQSIGGPEKELIGNLSMRRIVRREPVQYLVGNWDFHHITLNVRTPILIPRPETEELVELILKSETVRTSQACSFLDIGTGTGAILLAILKQRINATGVGIDINPEAVRLSRENSDLLDLSARTCFQQISVEEFIPETLFDVVASNPPYIPAKDMQALEREVKDHEDTNALHGGIDGMDVIRCILRRTSQLLKPGGDLWLEVDPSHPERIEALCRNDISLQELTFVEKHHDFRGFARFVHIRRRR
uniref:Peptide chain release factor N(5)-glutamine methyltransferase n=1 Tax=Rhodosorus marinus TaxID=101924 RepID=A0A7S3AAT4_9RHOD|mmetsp:Transcript_9544/g.41199  ORF Transcript_9544/g.41199 Transcript_9544/m.41199 type:complete len:334 (+) Transcript_9544:612-1613(+)